MKDVRETLAELLDDIGATCDVPINVDEDGCGTYEIQGGEYIADYLLANGVTVVVRCEVCRHCLIDNKRNDGLCMRTSYRERKQLDDFCSRGEPRTE